MSRANEKNPPTPAPATAAGPADVALVQPAPPAKATDPYQGRGGLYRIVGGVRKRIGGTAPATTQPEKAKE